MDEEIIAFAKHVADQLGSGDHRGAVASLQAAFDSMDEGEYHELVDTALPAAVGLGDTDSWASVAEAIDEPIGLFNLATILWRGTSHETEAVEIMKLAKASGVQDAGIALTEWLEWLGRTHEAMAAIDEYKARYGTNPRVSGLIGRLALKNEPTASDETVQLLAIASERYTEFLPAYWASLLASGRFEQARRSLERAADAGDADAALRLGNLLASQLNDPPASRAAYMRAIELGDGHAAHNLAIDLIGAGSVEEARHYLQLAIDRGDVDARETLKGLS